MTQLLVVRSKLKELVKKYGSKDQVNNVSADFALKLSQKVESMIDEAIHVEMAFCKDTLSFGVSGLSENLMLTYLKYVADQRFVQMGMKRRYKVSNPFPFMVLQDLQPLTNFFEKRVTEYQKGFDIKKESVVFNESF